MNICRSVGLSVRPSVRHTSVSIKCFLSLKVLPASFYQNFLEKKRFPPDLNDSHLRFHKRPRISSKWRFFLRKRDEITGWDDNLKVKVFYFDPLISCPCEISRYAHRRYSTRKLSTQKSDFVTVHSKKSVS